ncbi:MAG: ATP-grasp domain-containing protein [Pirellulales bacterium]
MSDRIVIVAASSRAAAFSALRAGFTPLCADLFADVDLRQAANVQRVQGYPSGVEIAVRQFGEIPVVYGGAFENYPDIVDRLAMDRTLYGNDAEVLRKIRDPFRVCRVLRGADLCTPEVQAMPDGLPRDGSWLQKPLQGGGGAGIVPWTPETRRNANVYYQRRIDGVSCSALYVASGARCELIGVTRQLVGEPWTAAGLFQYAGSIGPLLLSPDSERQWQAIGCELTQRFKLVGIFGVDAVWRQDGVWPVEVNPRYPASAEVLERAGCGRLMELHVEAFRSSLPTEVIRPDGKLPFGKAIVYARQDIVVPEALVALAISANTGIEWPEFGDIPHPGESVRGGRPVITVFAAGPVAGEVEDRLRAKVRLVEAMLYS